MPTPPVVSPREWQTAREDLLTQEKEATRALDALAARRRRMPATRVEKDYYSFMWHDPDNVCEGCSMFTDNVGHLAHLHARDVSFALVSHGPLAGRGVERLGSGWSFLDLVPFGRQETWEDSPAGWPQGPPYFWWRLHDEYAGEEAR